MYGCGWLRRLDVDHQPVRVGEQEPAVAARTRDAQPKLHHAFEVLHAPDFDQPGVARLDVERAAVSVCRSAPRIVTRRPFVPCSVTVWPLGDCVKVVPDWSCTSTEEGEPFLNPIVSRS